MRVGLLTDIGYGLPVDPETLSVGDQGSRPAGIVGGRDRASFRLDVTDAEYEALDLSFKLAHSQKPTARPTTEASACCRK